MDGTFIIGGIAALALVWGVITFNKLVTLRNRYDNGFAQIQVQLKRRYDLIPNLVEIAKKYMEHEKSTLENIVKARSVAVSAIDHLNPNNASSMAEMAKAEDALAGALGGLNIAIEAYPDLKANTTMLSLQEELTSTENKVSFSRQGYNDAVTRYNTSIEMFPNNIIGGMFNFKQAELLEFEDKKEIQKAVKVSF